MTDKKKMQIVRFFEAHCRDCNEVFAVPLLSDFAYGEFILPSEDGQAFAYLNAITESSFDLISNLVQEINEKENSGVPRENLGFMGTILDKLKRESGAKHSPTSRDLNRLHWVVAQCADEIDDKKLSNQYRCPKCRSGDIDYGAAIVVRDDEIPIASFERFRTLSETEQKGRVRELYNSSEGLF